MSTQNDMRRWLQDRPAIVPGRIAREAGISKELMGAMMRGDSVSERTEKAIFYAISKYGYQSIHQKKMDKLIEMKLIRYSQFLKVVYHMPISEVEVYVNEFLNQE